MQINFCTKTSAIWQFVGYGLYALKILVPLLIIILGVVDFAKASISSDDKAINKSITTLIQRFIWGICIFLVPTIVNLVMNLVTEATEAKEQAQGCYTCLLNPTSGECEAKVTEAKNSRNY